MKSAWEKSGRSGALRPLCFVSVRIMLALATMCVSAARLPAQMEPADSRKSPPTFSLTDAKGTPVRLSDYKGRVVLLNFWATWCAGCKTEIPWFIDFEKKYRNKGFDVIGVAMDEDGWKQVAPYVKEKQMNYTVVIGSETVGKLYELSSLPSTLLIDRDGKIAYAHTGVVDRGLCENLIRDLL